MEKIWHTNFYMANKNTKWYQLDSEAAYQQNLTERYDDLKANGWLDADFSYRFNSHGFRCNKFDPAQPTLMSLGCSHTFGIGLPVESVWGSLVSKALGLEHYNFGIGGASNDTAFRMAQHYIPILKPKAVVFASTEKVRFELGIDNNQFENLGVWKSDLSLGNLQKYWMINETNANMNYLKNQLAIKQLCYQNEIKFVHYEISQLPHLDFARDLQHYGPRTHRAIAKKILSYF